MRSFTTLSLITLLLGTRASSHGLREPGSHRLDARDPIIDICVSLNLDLHVPDINGILTGVGLLGESLTCPTLAPVFMKHINRRMHLSVGASRVS